MNELPISEKSSCGCGHDAELPELDVRAIPHAIRHAAIHGVVDSLRPGAAFILVAPHNPLPLLAEIQQRHGETIRVTYLEEGPEAWRLRLGHGR
ncbi:DUF2249 domain-containing protein [Arachnia propionica]|uniref:DUF2249 domain-containing protein n=1 Tax=Arachnia propionica TaxID=1750 RepID=A0A3P1WU21_9ACTN|nr:DUF2249 domain-containing protein [Arachnia propionica]RRD49506.1 DUF2249 domain-containing protein [Arachnia propionica]